MSREPTTSYFIRLILILLLVFLAGMLYWSSLLVEEDLQEVRTQLDTVQKSIDSLEEQMDALGNVSSFANEKSKQKTSVSKGQHIDPNLPNLLAEDRFYIETLPNLLGKAFAPKGAFKGDSVGKPKNLHPFSNWSQVAGWISSCSIAIASQLFGIYETLSPEMAFKMEERGIPNTAQIEYWLHLRDDVYWQPLTKQMFSEDIQLAPEFLIRHQVTAHDFKFYYDAMMNPNVQEAGAVALRAYYDGIEQITVIDDFTLAVRWRADKVLQHDGKEKLQTKYIAKLMTASLRPLARFVYQYFPDGSKIIEEEHPNTYLTNSIWAQNFNDHWAKNIIVSCGAWVFEKMNERQIVFKRNPNYYQPLAALALGNEIDFKDSGDAILEDFKAGKTDSYSLQPEQILDIELFLKSSEYQKQAEAGAAIKRLDFVQRSYQYIGWNETDPLFASKLARRAMTMAIDRNRIIDHILNGMGVAITGPWFVQSANNDASITPWPYDPREAKRLLEEEGWYANAKDGILEKEIDGKRIPFSFSLTYYVKNPTLAAICSFIATSLKEIGVQCNLNGVDITDLSAIFDEKSFDAIALGWSLGAPPDMPRQLWHSDGAKQKGSSNAIGFASHEADIIIDALEYVSDKQERIKLYHQFHKIIHEEQPYTFLYTPKIAFLYREYLENVFIPAKRQDLIPGADVEEPQASIFWLNQGKKS